MWICDSILTPEKFIMKCFYGIFDNDVILSFNDSTKIRYTWGEADTSLILACAKRRIIKDNRIYRFREVVIKNGNDKKNLWTLNLDFIATKNGYRFYGCDYNGGKQCFQ